MKFKMDEEQKKLQDLNDLFIRFIETITDTQKLFNESIRTMRKFTEGQTMAIIVMERIEEKIDLIFANTTPQEKIKE